MIQFILNLLIGGSSLCCDWLVTVLGYIGISESLNLLHVGVGFFVRFLIDLVALVFDSFILYLHWLFIYWDFFLVGRTKELIPKTRVINKIVSKSPRHFIKEGLLKDSRKCVKSVASVIDGLVVTAEMRERAINWAKVNVRCRKFIREERANRLSLGLVGFEIDSYRGLQILLGLIEVSGRFTFKRVTSSHLPSQLSGISLEVTIHNLDILALIHDLYELGSFTLRPVFRHGEIEDVVYLYTITEETGLNWFKDFLVENPLLGVPRHGELIKAGYVMLNKDSSVVSVDRWLGMIIGSTNVVQYGGGFAIEILIGGGWLHAEVLSQFSDVFPTFLGASFVTFPEDLTSGGLRRAWRWHITNIDAQKSFIDLMKSHGFGQVYYESVLLAHYYGIEIVDSANFSTLLNCVNPLVDLKGEPTKDLYRYLLESIKMDSYMLLRGDRVFLIEQRLEEEVRLGLIDFSKENWGFVEKWMYHNLILGERLTSNWWKVDRADHRLARRSNNFAFVPGPYDPYRNFMCFNYYTWLEDDDESFE